MPSCGILELLMQSLRWTALVTQSWRWPEWVSGCLWEELVGSVFGTLLAEGFAAHWMGVDGRCWQWKGFSSVSSMTSHNAFRCAPQRAG